MAAKRVLSPVEEFYVRGHKDSRTPGQIATDLGVSLKVIETWLRKEATRVAEAPPPPFAENNGTVAMTGARAEADDRAPRPEGYNKAFFDTIKSGIHVIDPDKRIR